ncbi:mechanosensitive ion channel family protein [Candidatus Pacearchaeota archaeon]|nr:MAG: mechanosensitive ion channel family protein [Candidatus Pacearchaeota archaeon]
MALGQIIGLATYVQNDFLRAVIVFVLLAFVLRLALAIIEKIFVRLTARTKTKLDDMIYEATTKPLTILATLIALRAALEEISLHSALERNTNLAIYSAIVAIIGYITFVVVDIFLKHSWTIVSTKSKIKIDKALIGIIHSTLKIFVIFFVVLYILDLWGVEILPLLGALGVAGIAVALALQPTLGNMFAGVAMILDRSVRVGDWVVLEDGTWGVIEKVGIRSTKIRSFDNEMLVIPNSKIADSIVRNVSLPEPKVRVVLPFGVAYGSNIDKVKKIVLAEIKKLKHVLDDPKPSVRFLEMGESSLNFKAFFYVDSYENRYATIDEANTRIYNALNKAGISIPFPQMDVHLKKE